MRIKEKYKDIFGNTHTRYIQKRSKKKKKPLEAGFSFERPYDYMSGLQGEKTFGIKDTDRRFRKKK